ncbi:CpaE-like family protein [Actinomycetospora chlora]|uniref:CpaE-like family protein n=1 Tax=Actinomycetospora chlora TaxID=663608 RepID=A0ABP9CQL4_9PSEU
MATTAARGGTARRVVVVTDDEELLDDVVRLAAAAEVELERVPDAAGLRRRWHAAALVLLDEDAARSVAPWRPGRRDGVVLLCRGEPPGSLWERAVAVGAEHVVSLPDGEDWLVRTLAEAGPVATPAGAGPGRVVAVVGGRGGAGASVLAVAVACHARSRDTRVLLVDCDPLGGGLDLVAGAEELEGLRWSGLALGGGGGGRVSVESLHEALPSPDGMLTVLACDRAGSGPEPDAAVAVVEAGRRAGEVVVCDLPRQPTDAALAVADAADLLVVVLPAEVRAVAATARVVEPYVERGVPLRLVVRGPAPGGLDAEDVAHALGLEVLVSVPPEPGIAASLDRGKLPGVRRGPLQDAAAAVLDALDVATDPGRAA